MESKGRHELYDTFLDFVRAEAQLERKAVNRLMFSVLFWCLLCPAVVVVMLLILMKAGFVPLRTKANLDLVILFFPLCYSIYFLSAEVLVGIPAVFKRGGIASSLQPAHKESLWRENVVQGLSKISTERDDWKWITESFRMDLDALQYRNRYLTALAGAVFYILMQGLDWLGDGWIENSASDTTQFAGLGLFLVLLYLSGSQTYHSLKRFLNCAELMILKS